MKKVNIHEAKTHLSRLLKRVAAGEEIVIARAGTPVARLVPLENGRSAREMGFVREGLRVGEDFDAPLPADVLSAFFGGRAG
jgi:prevent-host-death family protein